MFATQTGDLPTVISCCWRSSFDSDQTGRLTNSTTSLSSSTFSRTPGKPDAQAFISSGVGCVSTRFFTTLITASFGTSSPLPYLLTNDTMILAARSYSAWFGSTGACVACAEDGLVIGAPDLACVLVRSLTI